MAKGDTGRVRPRQVVGSRHCGQAAGLAGAGTRAKAGMWLCLGRTRGVDETMRRSSRIEDRVEAGRTNPSLKV